MNWLTEMIPVLVLLIAAIYLMLKSSFMMLEKKHILVFVPIWLVGLEMCFEASLFYFNAPINELTGFLHDVFLFFLMLFYTHLLVRSSQW